MILAHYSDKPITRFDMSVHRTQYREYFKPNGLWLSVDDAEQNWQDWCVSESFGLDRFKYRTEATLKPGNNVKVIHSVGELDAFHDEFGLDILADRRVLSDTSRRDYLDWGRVMGRWDGLLIPTYYWERRLPGPMWYYAWDCASGCIWNGNAVELGKSQPFSIDDYAKKTVAA